MGDENQGAIIKKTPDGLLSFYVIEVHACLEKLVIVRTTFVFPMRS